MIKTIIDPSYTSFCWSTMFFELFYITLSVKLKIVCRQSTFKFWYIFITLPFSPVALKQQRRNSFLQLWVAWEYQYLARMRQDALAGRKPALQQGDGSAKPSPEKNNLTPTQNDISYIDKYFSYNQLKSQNYDDCFASL